MTNISNQPALPDLDLSKLNIQPDDPALMKFMMLIEGAYGMGVKHSIEKYGYTEQRYYQLRKKFIKEGFQALINQKPGPKENHVRTEKVNQQIIQLRYLDPDSSAEVIAQKLKQMGHKVSVRSVARTISQYGLQKKKI